MLSLPIAWVRASLFALTEAFPVFLLCYFGSLLEDGCPRGTIPQQLVVCAAASQYSYHREVILVLGAPL